MAEAPGHGIKGLHGFVNDFRPDAVAGEEADFRVHGVPFGCRE
jgi:hypothetical protein